MNGKLEWDWDAVAKAKVAEAERVAAQRRRPEPKQQRLLERVLKQNPPPPFGPRTPHPGDDTTSD